MKLHWSPRSPFVRKVMIVLHETGQQDSVELVRSVVGLSQVNEALLADNPLNKIPTLVLDDGRALFDSRVICEYLDGRHGQAALFPAEPAARFQALTWQALADGMTDTLLLWRNWYLDRGLPASDPTDAFLTAFGRKTRSALDALERAVPALEATQFGIGHIAIVCGLGQVDFRWPDMNWRNTRPALAAWQAGMAQRPSVQATQVVDDGG